MSRFGMSRYLSLLLFISLAWGQLDNNQDSPKENDNFRKHNLSIGIFDDRTGLSLIGYTYNIRQTELDEYFIGGGTMLIAFTGTVGWKHYYKKSKLSISSVLCGQFVMHLGFEGILPTIAYTLEYNLAKWAQVKLGGLGFMLLGGTAGESGGNIGVLPFMGLNFRF